MATVSGTILHPSGLPRTALITFKPLSTPYYQSDSIVTSRNLTTTSAADGTFSISLNQGYYEVAIGGDTFEIDVAASGGAYALEDIVTSGLSFMPPASNTNQGTFAGIGSDFVLPANAVNVVGDPVPTGFQNIVYGAGKFQVEISLSIAATSRNVALLAQGEEIYTAYIWDATNSQQIGIAQTLSSLYTGTTGQLILRGTVTIASATNVLLEVYAAGNTGSGDTTTTAPDSVGKILITKSTYSISRLP